MVGCQEKHLHSTTALHHTTTPPHRIDQSRARVRAEQSPVESNLAEVNDGSLLNRVESSRVELLLRRRVNFLRYKVMLEPELEL